MFACLSFLIFLFFVVCTEFFTSDYFSLKYGDGDGEYGDGESKSKIQENIQPKAKKER